MLLVGAVFIYTPGDLFITQIIKVDGSASNPMVWIVYGLIFYGDILHWQTRPLQYLPLR